MSFWKTALRRLVLLQGLIQPAQAEEEPAEAVVRDPQVDGLAISTRTVVNHLLPGGHRRAGVGDGLLSPAQLEGTVAAAAEALGQVPAIVDDAGILIGEFSRDVRSLAIRRERVGPPILRPQASAYVEVSDRMADQDLGVVGIGGGEFPHDPERPLHKLALVYEAVLKREQPEEQMAVCATVIMPLPATGLYPARPATARHRVQRSACRVGDIIAERAPPSNSGVGNLFLIFPPNTLTSRRNCIKMISTVNQGAPMQYEINSASRLPIYQQLVQQVREAIARGDLKPEEQLPSVRQLSRDLVINPNTVARAYTELEREGLLNNRPGRGVFVAEPKDELTKDARRRRLLESLDRFLTEAVHLAFSEEEVLRLVSTRSRQFQWNPAKAGSK